MLTTSTLEYVAFINADFIVCINVSFADFELPILKCVTCPKAQLYQNSYFSYYKYHRKL